MLFVESPKRRFKILKCYATLGCFSALLIVDQENVVKYPHERFHRDRDFSSWQ